MTFEVIHLLQTVFKLIFLQLCSRREDFNCQSVLCGPSAIAELPVFITYNWLYVIFIKLKQRCCHSFAQEGKADKLQQMGSHC